LSPRPQIDHIRKPQMLAAAAAVIAERGVAATRIVDVAERAGTSPAAVLYWFGSKDSLLAEALTFEEDRFYEVLSDRLAGVESPRDRMRLLIEAAARDPDWVLWMEVWARALRDSEMAEARQRLDQRWRDEIAGIIREGQAVGEFGDGDVEGVALTLASLIDGLVVQATLGDPSVDSERIVELALRVAGLLLEAQPEGTEAGVR
jgi:AcrR family transcriptional regulator